MPSHSRQRRQPAWRATSVGCGTTVRPEKVIDGMAATSPGQNRQTTGRFHREDFQRADMLGSLTRAFRSFPASQVLWLHFQPWWGLPKFELLPRKRSGGRVL